MRIRLRTSRRAHTLELADGATIGDLKEIAAKTAGVADGRRFIFSTQANGAPLQTEDSADLRELGVQDSSVVWLLGRIEEGDGGLVYQAPEGADNNDQADATAATQPAVSAVPAPQPAPAPAPAAAPSAQPARTDLSQRLQSAGPAPINHLPSPPAAVAAPPVPTGDTFDDEEFARELAARLAVESDDEDDDDGVRAPDPTQRMALLEQEVFEDDRADVYARRPPAIDPDVLETARAAGISDAELLRMLDEEQGWAAAQRFLHEGERDETSNPLRLGRLPRRDGRGRVDDSLYAPYVSSPSSPPPPRHPAVHPADSAAGRAPSHRSAAAATAAATAAGAVSRSSAARAPDPTAASASRRDRQAMPENIDLIRRPEPRREPQPTRATREGQPRPAVERAASSPPRPREEETSMDDEQLAMAIALSLDDAGAGAVAPPAARPAPTPHRSDEEVLGRPWREEAIRLAAGGPPAAVQQPPAQEPPAHWLDSDYELALALSLDDDGEPDAAIFDDAASTPAATVTAARASSSTQERRRAAAASSSRASAAPAAAATSERRGTQTSAIYTTPQPSAESATRRRRSHETSALVSAVNRREARESRPIPASQPARRESQSATHHSRGERASPVPAADRRTRDLHAAWLDATPSPAFERWRAAGAGSGSSLYAPFGVAANSSRSSSASRRTPTTLADLARDDRVRHTPQVGADLRATPAARAPQSTRPSSGRQSRAQQPPTAQPQPQRQHQHQPQPTMSTSRNGARHVSGPYYARPEAPPMRAPADAVVSAHRNSGGPDAAAGAGAPRQTAARPVRTGEEIAAVHQQHRSRVEAGLDRFDSELLDLRRPPSGGSRRR